LHRRGSETPAGSPASAASSGSVNSDKADVPRRLQALRRLRLVRVEPRGERDDATFPESGRRRL
jgi:hypothetical protein